MVKAAGRITMIAVPMVRLVRLAGLFLGAALAVACDKVPLFAPSQSTITVTAGQRVLALNASTEVTAVVVEPSGTPVQNGTAVRFTTTLGRVDPVEVETRNGVATTTFHAGSTSGIADVRAFSGSAGSSSSAGGNDNAAANTSATNVVTFTIGAAAADTVTVRTNPSSVPASGGTVEVNAIVLDANGQGVAGIPVSFSANNGTLTNTLAISNSNGVATVGLTTNVETTVSATAGSKTAATAAVVSVRGAPSVTMTCQGSGAAGLTSCSQTVGQPFSFTVAKATGSTPLVSAFLEFDDGNRASLGTLSSAATVTHTYYSQNAYTATVTATDVNGQVTTASVAVNVTSAVIRAPLTVTFSTATLDTATATGQRANFTVAVTAAGETNIPVESVSWSFGDGISAVTSGLSTAHVYNATDSVPAASTTSTRSYTVAATVRTQDGRTGTARTEIQVKLNAANP